MRLQHVQRKQEKCFDALSRVRSKRNCSVQRERERERLITQKLVWENTAIFERTCERSVSKDDLSDGRIIGGECGQNWYSSL